MKAFIMGLGVVILLCAFNAFQVEHDAYFRAQYQLKVMCDDASSAGSLMLETPKFALGKRVYDKTTAEILIKQLIGLNMGLDANMSPTSDSFWGERVHYKSYYVDDEEILTVYEDGVLQSQSAFSYNTILTESYTGYMKLITEPTVIVSIDAPYPDGRVTWLNWPNIKRSSAYEDLDRY